MRSASRGRARDEGQFAEQHLPGVAGRSAMAASTCPRSGARRSADRAGAVRRCRGVRGGLGEGLQHGVSDRLAEQHGDGVADLAVSVGLGAREPEGVRERLHARGLADGERAVLVGMDVPVAVLGDVGGDRCDTARPSSAACTCR